MRMKVGRERPYIIPLLTTKAECSMMAPWSLSILAVVGLYRA
jgi:hypothetical protein